MFIKKNRDRELERRELEVPRRLLEENHFNMRSFWNSEESDLRRQHRKRREKTCETQFVPLSARHAPLADRDAAHHTEHTSWTNQ